MKNLIKLFGLCILIMITFFYTDKIIDVVREEDPIMLSIRENIDFFKKESVNAKIIDNTIITGINGLSVNVEKSYKKMKEYGKYYPDYFVFDRVKPDISITDNYDKFIVGSGKKEYVSILYILSSSKYFNLLKSKDVPINFFATYDYFINNLGNIKKTNTHEFYNYGDNGKYTSDNIIYANNLISRIKSNNALYCLSTTYSSDTLNTCSKNNYYTIVPNMICNNNCYNNIKNNISGGEMILISDNSVKELDNIINYIKSSGYEIVGLNTLLSE